MIANIVLYIFFLATLLYSLFLEEHVIIVGGRSHCQHFLAHGEMKQNGKMVDTDQLQLQEPPSMVQQRFTSVFDTFQVE